MIGIDHNTYGTNSTARLPNLLNALDVIHGNKNTTQLLANYAHSQDQVNYVNSVDPSRSDPALSDIARNAQVVSDRCAEHIEDLTGVGDRNEFNNLCNTVNDLITNGSTRGEANEAINRNNNTD